MFGRLREDELHPSLIISVDNSVASVNAVTSFKVPLRAIEGPV